MSSVEPLNTGRTKQVERLSRRNTCTFATDAPTSNPYSEVSQLVRVLIVRWCFDHPLRIIARLSISSNTLLPPQTIIGKQSRRKHGLLWNGCLVQFSGRWYLRARESPYSLHPISQNIPQWCLGNNSNVDLIDDDSFLISAFETVPMLV